jgi:ribosome biogenesis GTPase
VVAGSRERYRIVLEDGEALAEAAGRIRHAGTLPSVGDWVRVRVGDGQVTIVQVLPRRSELTRTAAGTATVGQVLAANVDTAFVVSGLDDDFNPRRLERYLVWVRAAGVRAVLVLNKTDVCGDLDWVLERVRVSDPELEVCPISARQASGLDSLAPFLALGQTVVVVGSSGAGKSTLVNELLGTNRQATKEVRTTDSHGRHTTTHREMLLLPDGGLLIDTPGLRELSLWQADDVDDGFPDVAQHAQSCRFRDCRHDEEPGCAVQNAVQDGSLDETRVENRAKLLRELHRQEVRHKEKKMSGRRPQPERRWRAGSRDDPG